MGRGQSSSAGTLATPRRRTIKGAISNSPIVGSSPSRVELATRGTLALTAFNKHEIGAEQFELLFQIAEAEAARGPGEPVSIRDLSERTGIAAPELSRRMTEMTATGDLERVEIPGTSTEAYRPLRDLDEYYATKMLSVPGAMNPRGRQAPPLDLMIFNSPEEGHERILINDSTHYGNGYHVDIADFTRAAKSIAELAIKGEDQGFAVLDAGKAPSGVERGVAVFPYRFKKGRRQQPMVAFKSTFLGSASPVSWSGGEHEADRFLALVPAKDVLDAVTLLKDRRASERGLL